jgi:hypothetical protein
MYRQMVMLDVILHPIQGLYLCPPVKQWDSVQFIHKESETMQVSVVVSRVTHSMQVTETTLDGACWQNNPNMFE